jgi:hypothetical protein
MARVSVSNGSTSTVINFDAPKRLTDTFQSVVIAQVFDELTNRSIDQPIRVTTDLPNVIAKSSSFGICGLAGIPTQCVHGLKNQAYPLNIRFEAEGYEPLSISTSIPQNVNFPDEFLLQDLGQILLRRSVYVVGSTMSLDAQNLPHVVPSAVVAITGIWRTISDLTGNVDTTTSFLSVNPALYASRPSGANLTVVPGTPVLVGTTLNQSARVGATIVEVHSLVGIAANDVIGIDLGDKWRVEYIRVTTVEAPSDPNSPATLTLAFPLKFDHSAGVAVATVGVAAGAPDTQLTEEAFAGDWTVFVSSELAFGSEVVVKVSSPPQPDEFLRFSPYEVTGNPDGFYRMPRLSRIAAIQVTATAGILSAVAEHRPNYNLNQNTLNLTLK